MARKFQQGDRFVVTFEAGRNGSPLTRVNGKISFPERGGKLPRVGETWEVELVGTNPRGTVHFLRLIRRIPRWRVDPVTGRAERWVSYLGRYFPAPHDWGSVCGEDCPTDLRQKSSALIRKNLAALLEVVASERVKRIVWKVLEGPDGSIWARPPEEERSHWGLSLVDGEVVWSVTIDATDGRLWETGGGPTGWANAERILQKMEARLGLPVGEAEPTWWEAGVAQFRRDVKQMREEGL